MGTPKMYSASYVVASGWGLGKEHVYYVYDPDKDGDGDPTTYDVNDQSSIPEVVRGGPVGSIFNPGQIEVEAGTKIDKSDDNFSPGQTMEDRNFKEMASGAEAQNKWNGYTQAAASLVGGQNNLDPDGKALMDEDYFLVGKNSNSVANTVAALNGDDFRKIMPDHMATNSYHTPGGEGYLDPAGDSTLYIHKNPDGAGRINIIRDGGGNNTYIAEKNAVFVIVPDEDPNTSNTIVLEGVDSNDIILWRMGNDLLIINNSDPQNPRTIGQVFGYYNPDNGTPVDKIEFIPDEDGNGGNGPDIDLTESPPIPERKPELPAGWAEGVCYLVEDAENNSSPLVLDLDGDGIELINVNGSDAVYWDIDLDGFAEASGWVAGDDGLLAIDLNNDGIINNSSELFGDQTGFENGFLALAAYDSNNDGLITSTDAEWENLIIWRDINGNGYSESAEQFSLDELLITQINLGYSNVNYTLAGNVIKQQSTFTMDGNTRTIVDAYFQYSEVNTIYDLAYNVDYTTLFLSTLRGYGEIPSLHIAVSLDNDTSVSNSLISLLVSFHDQSFSTLFNDTDDLWEDVRDIMFRWAGVDDVDPSNRNTHGGGIDGRELAFLEAFTGTAFLQRGWMTDPGYWAARQLEEAFNIAQQNIYARLVAQGAGGELFEGNWFYNIATDSIDGVTGLDTLKIAELETLAGTMSDKVTYWQNVVRMVEFTIGVSNLSSGDAAELNTAIYNSDNSLSLTQIVGSLEWLSSAVNNINGTSGNDTLTGTIADDNINGGYGNDTIIGGIGADNIDGGDGDDVMNGQLGSDIIRGRGGNDIYMYELGHGHDVYQESSTGTDKIVFGTGIVSGDITISRVGNYDMYIVIDDGTVTGSIVIENQFFIVAGGGSIEMIEFYDTSTIDLFSLSFTTNGTAGNDVIAGVHGNVSTGEDTIYGGDGHDTINAYASNEQDYAQNWLYGEGGNDTLRGGRGNDVLDGGTGNDSLAGDQGDDTLIGGTGDDNIAGGSGNDAFYYNLGDGNDTLSDSSGTSDKIVFGAGIEEMHLNFGRSGNTLIINIDTGTHTGSISINSQLFLVAGGGYIEQVEFADASTLNLFDVELTTYGTAGNDVIYGAHGSLSSGRDTIYGGDGNDTLHAYAGNEQDYQQNWLYGEAGNDNLDGGRGNDVLDGGIGNDTMYGDQGDDTLIGGTGDDIIRGESGSDTYIYNSGDGHDTYYETTTNIDRILFGAGITLAHISFGRDGNNLIINIDDGLNTGSITINNQLFVVSGGGWIELLEFADNSTFNLATVELTSYGTEGDDVIRGAHYSRSTGVDTIYGGDGNDTLYSAAGSYEYTANFLYGEAGNDTLNGSRGEDTLYGGTGDDVLKGDSGNDILIGGEGNDNLQGGGGIDVASYADASSAVVVNLSLTTAQNTGGAGVDTLSTIEDLIGSAYNDTLSGSTAVNVIQGGDGNDTIYGNSGNDTLYGDNGNDIIYGDTGNDNLYGGSGADTFKFTVGGGVDIIKDFSLTDGDILDISALLSGYDPLTKVITDYIQITDSGANSIVKVDANGLTGGTAWTTVATLEGITGLTDEAALVTSGNLVAV